MIAALELVFANSHHAPTNAGLLKAIMLAAPDDQVTLAAPLAHRTAVTEILGAEATALGRLDIEIMPPGQLRLARIAAQFRAMRKTVQTLQPRALICLSSTPETFFACRLLSLIFRNLPIVVVLHGNLYHSIAWRSRDPRHRWLDSRSSLFIGRHSPIRFVVLETAIRQAALALDLLPANRTDVWPHPIGDNEARSPSHRLRPGKTSIAFLGGARRTKGFDTFLDIMQSALRHDPDGYRFSLIGAIQDSFAAERLVGLELSDDMLPRSEYLDRLRRVDYVCMPLQPDTYALTASASLLDCIASATPLIATRTAAIAHMAADGPIGFLADSPDALASIVLDRARLADCATYELFQRNLVRLQQQRLPAAIASAVRATLGDKGVRP